MSERMEARNVTLHPSDWLLVDQIAEQMGVRSVSGGLRVLIAQYRALAQQAAEQAMGLKVDEPRVRAAVQQVVAAVRAGVVQPVPAWAADTDEVA